MLNNISLIFPELLIGTSLTFILIIGAIYSKLNEKISQNIKIIILSIWTLVIASFMFILQLKYNINDLVSSNLIHINNLKIIFKAFICITSAIILFMSNKIIKEGNLKENEFSIIILLATIGLLMMINSNELIILYLSIEIYSLSLYILASIIRWSEKSTEAGLKYFVLGSLGSGLYLFGAAIIYMVTGELTYQNLYNYLITNENNNLLIVGSIFIIIALLFKMAAAPLHMWAPDVYEGAPIIITSFFATVPKLPILITLINFIYNAIYPIIDNIQPLLIIVSISSMLIGSITGLNQSKFKRLIAYSSISHVGFIILGLTTNSITGIQISFLYTIIYVISSINLFASILFIYRDTDYITELSGLSKRNPLLATIISISLFSAAGVPPLAGFLSKFLIISETLNKELYFIAGVAVISSTIALIYYIRITKWMFFKDSAEYNIKVISDIINPKEKYDFILSIISGSTFYFIITILIYPTILIKITNYLILFLLV